MANVKFSDFAVRTTVPTVDYIVGYQGADNIQIAPTDLSSYFLPLTGGTMVGNIHFDDGINANFGGTDAGWELEMYVNVSNDAYIKKTATSAGDLTIQNSSTDGDIIFSSDDGGGGTTTYMTIDGGAENIHFSKPVGIGVTPTTLLDIGGMADPVVLIKSDVGGDPQLRFDASAANRSGLIKFYDNGAVAGGFIDYHHLGDKMNFGAGSVSTVTMTVTDGKVGIGTTTPSYSLEVDSTATVATNPSYIVTTAGTFEMAIGSQNSPGVKQEAFVGTLGATDFKLKANNTDIGRFTTTKKFVIGRDANPSSTVEVFTGGNSVHAAMKLQHDSFGADRLCGIGFELGSTQIKSAIAVKADSASIGTHGRSNIIFCVDSVDDANPVSHNDEKMRITHAGDVGIGIIPLAKFQVKCDTNVNFTTTENAGDLRINAVNDAVAATIGLEFNASAYEFLGAGTTTFSGGITANAGITVDGLFIDNNTIAHSGGDITLDAGGDIILDAAGDLQVLGIVEYADNAAALAGGLTAGAFYRTGDLLKVVH